MTKLAIASLALLALAAVALLLATIEAFKDLEGQNDD